MACSPLANTADNSVSAYLWSLNITAGEHALPGSCATAMNGVVASLESDPQLKIEILTYSDVHGSSSMALAQLSKLSKQLTEMLSRAAHKTRVKVVATYGINPEARSEISKPLTGRIVLRLASKN